MLNSLSPKKGLRYPEMGSEDASSALWERVCPLSSGPSPLRAYTVFPSLGSLLSRCFPSAAGPSRDYRETLHGKLGYLRADVLRPTSAVHGSPPRLYYVSGSLWDFTNLPLTGPDCPRPFISRNVVLGKFHPSPSEILIRPCRDTRPRRIHLPPLWQDDGNKRRRITSNIKITVKHM